MTPPHQHIYCANTARLLGSIASAHATRALESKNAYLQCRATAWVILCEHADDRSKHYRKAKAIVSGTLNTATIEEWRIARVVVQRSMSSIRDGEEPKDLLYVEVLIQLQNYNKGHSAWPLIVEMILQDAAMQLKLYRLWRKKTTEETRMTYSRAEIKGIFIDVGLSSENRSRGEGAPMAWNDPRLSTCIVRRTLCSPCRWVKQKLRGHRVQAQTVPDGSEDGVEGSDEGLDHS